MKSEENLKKKSEFSSPKTNQWCIIKICSNEKSADKKKSRQQQKKARKHEILMKNMHKGVNLNITV